MTESVHKLVWRDPHQLYQRLESQLRDFVMELRMRLVDLLQKQAKNPNLAQVCYTNILPKFNCENTNVTNQSLWCTCIREKIYVQEFIQSLLGGHDKLCEAGKLVSSNY